jgi:hypothetical protein
MILTWTNHLFLGRGRHSWFSTIGAGPLIGWTGMAWTTWTVAPYVTSKKR